MATLARKPPTTSTITRTRPPRILKTSFIETSFMGWNVRRMHPVNGKFYQFVRTIRHIREVVFRDDRR